MSDSTDGKRWVPAPVGTAPTTSGGVTGVLLAPGEHVEWTWTNGPSGSYVSGYEIKTFAAFRESEDEE